MVDNQRVRDAQGNAIEETDLDPNASQGNCCVICLCNTFNGQAHDEGGEFRPCTFRIFRCCGKDICCGTMFRVHWLMIFALAISTLSILFDHKKIPGGLRDVCGRADTSPCIKEIGTWHMAFYSWVFFLIFWVTVLFITTCHEWGHAYTAKLRGGQIKWVLLWMMGGLVYLKEPVIQEEEVREERRRRLERRGISEHDAERSEPPPPSSSPTTPRARDPQMDTMNQLIGRPAVGTGADHTGEPTPTLMNQDELDAYDPQYREVDERQVYSDILTCHRLVITFMGPLMHIPLGFAYFGLFALVVWSLRDGHDPQYSVWECIKPTTFPNEFYVNHCTNMSIGVGTKATEPYLWQFEGSMRSKLWTHVLGYQYFFFAMQVNWVLFIINMGIPAYPFDCAKILVFIMQRGCRVGHRACVITLLVIFFPAIGFLLYLCKDSYASASFLIVIFLIVDCFFEWVTMLCALCQLALHEHDLFRGVWDPAWDRYVADEYRRMMDEQERILGEHQPRGLQQPIRPQNPTFSGEGRTVGGGGGGPGDGGYGTMRGNGQQPQRPQGPEGSFEGTGRRLGDV